MSSHSHHGIPLMRALIHYAASCREQVDLDLIRLQAAAGSPAAIRYLSDRGLLT